MRFGVTNLIQSLNGFEKTGPQLRNELRKH